MTQTIYAAVELGIPYLLAKGERTSDELAEASGADPSALYRLLRALASLGILHEANERRFSLTPFGEPLRSDVQGSLHGWLKVDNGSDHVWRSRGNFAGAVREGKNSFRMLHDTDIWEWRADHPEESAIFDDAMMSLTGAGNAAHLGGVRLRALRESRRCRRWQRDVARRDPCGASASDRRPPRPRSTSSPAPSRYCVRPASSIAARSRLEASSRRCPKAVTRTS